MNILHHRSPSFMAGIAAFFLAIPIGAANAAGPSVQGPVAGKFALTLGNFDVTDLGYVSEEFFISGDATSYTATAAPADGRWTAAPAGTAPYASRIVVIRPKDAKAFNGTVVVEWLNVSLGVDTAADWFMLHRELIRDGYAYVGVSAQKVGVDGGVAALTNNPTPLTKLDPVRYGKLSHPGDAFSFDIFSQAGRAIRGGGVNVLGPLKVRHLLAIGESQSAFFLTTYVNAIQPRDKVYDGYLIHSRGGLASALDGGRLRLEPAAGESGIRIRTDLSTPVLTLLTETDVVGLGYGFFFARQPDTDRIRAWEIAGTSHADNYIWHVAQVDSGKESIADLAAAFAPTLSLMGTEVQPPPINAAPQHHYVLQAALHQLDLWVASGKLPPHGAPLDTTAPVAAKSAPVLVRDDHGNARGGIRSPWLDVPTATFSGLRKDNGIAKDRVANLSGSTEVFDAAMLARLYPGGRAEYLGKFRTALDQAVKSGFILAADAPEIAALAQEMYPRN
jgi:hypothetical protein